MAGTTSTLLLALAGLVTCQAPGRPREAGVPVPAVGDHAAYSRWMVRSMTWGRMSTISTQASIAGYPFGNPVSFADGGTGNPYMCVSPLDSSVKDLQANPKFSLTLSAAQGQNAPAACAPRGGDGGGDAGEALVLGCGDG